ncbi:MAG TPA: serine/threonine-protein kinase, partial [Pyrinomonadaceae bacterium]
AVYEAIDQRLDTTVALKETLFAEERLRKQFEREARLLARLHHPALPRVSDHFSEGDGQFLVMQFIPGDDLSEMMNRKRGPFPADQVLTWADQLLDALDYLHTQDPQIVHRDIKPQNLKLTSRGQIILLDFGLAKGQAGDISRVTTSASIYGYTPNYAPLEQIQGLGTDPRSDLYALGATLYHLLTGVKPPDALTRAAALVNGQPDPLTPGSVANPAIARDVDDVLAKAMAQSRDQRYATAADMRKALHGTEQASTVVDRAEANTVLFSSAAKTVAPATQAATNHATVRTGETTVVRPVHDRRGPRVLPWALSVVGLLVLACGVFAFVALRNRNSNNNVVQVTATSTPAASPAIDEPTVAPSAEPTAKASKTEKEKPQPTDEADNAADNSASKEEERAAREEEKRIRDEERRAREEEKKKRRADEPDDENPGPEHRSEPPGVPVPPEARGPNRPRKMETQVLPGGVIMRRFPNGSPIITMPDGTKVFVSPEGTRTTIPPPRRKRQQPPPSSEP